MNNESEAHPLAISVVIPNYNSWTTTERCLASLESQRHSPLEVIVVDDGSTDGSLPSEPPPSDLNISIVRIPHSGVSTARNTGLQRAEGSLVLFVDADCHLDQFALANLVAVASEHPQDQTFQLKIAGDISTIVGIAEDIHQTSVQKIMLEADGRIKWLNTAGFAVRRDFGIQLGELFHKRARRAQDTHLLGRLLSMGHMPRYASDSIVFHAPPLSPPRYILKAHSATRNSRDSCELISAMGVSIAATGPQRRQMFREMSAKAARVPRGWIAFGVLLARDALKRVTRIMTGVSLP